MNVHGRVLATERSHPPLGWRVRKSVLPASCKRLSKRISSGIHPLFGHGVSTWESPREARCEDGCQEQERSMLTRFRKYQEQHAKAANRETEAAAPAERKRSRAESLGRLHPGMTHHKRGMLVSSARKALQSLSPRRRGCLPDGQVIQNESRRSIFLAQPYPHH